MLYLIGYSSTAHAQLLITGSVVDSVTLKPLSYVNIGIKKKNRGAVSRPNGAFSLSLSNENLSDTLTFSLVGYAEATVPIKKLAAASPLTIKLSERVITLDEISISGSKAVEKKFGIKKRNALIHFTDGMFLKEDIFEIGQGIKLGDRLSQITSVNLYITAPRKDSASFRVNFYRLDDDRPSGRIVDKSILQRHPIREGWLTFDLRAYNIFLKGDFMVAVELIPETNAPSGNPIYYEVKLGGASRSFYRRNSLGKWNTPPHHYCLYLTALVDKATPVGADDEESIPDFHYPSNSVNDTFSIFVRLPTDYRKNPEKRYPVLYHLDGNAYFDPIGSSVGRLTKKKKLRVEPIVVGIGYRNAYLMDSLRVRDYTYPAALPSDSFSVSGGGERFYSFIKNELLPEIDKRYRTDTVNRTLMGHSFGGYFALFALLKESGGSPVFNTIVAASPSLFYHNNYLKKQFAAHAGGNTPNRVRKLFLSVGGLETAALPDTSFAEFAQLLEKNGAVRVTARIYEALEHMGTAVPSFEEGIEFSFGK